MVSNCFLRGNAAKREETFKHYADRKCARWTADKSEDFASLPHTHTHTHTHARARAHMYGMLGQPKSSIDLLRPLMGDLILRNDS